MTRTPSRSGEVTAIAGSGLIGALRRHARERPDAEAVGEVGGDGGNERACSYCELAGLVSARARRLRGCVAPGAVVIAVLPSGVEFAAWFCAAIEAGVRLLPMHPQVAGPEALAVARRVDAAGAIVAPGMAAGPLLEHLALREDGSLGTPREVGLLGGVVLGSSGTTGLPKLALRESASLDADAAGVIAGMGMTAEDRVAFAMPLGHSYGVDVLVGVLTAGSALRVLPRFDAQVLARELEEGVTVLPGVPFVLEALARERPRRKSTLRLALSAGSPLPARVRSEFVRTWGVEIGQLYGATELGTVAMDMPGAPGFASGSVGLPLPGVSMRVVDVDEPRRELRDGDEGHLAVRAGSMLSRYLDGEAPMIDGHFLTGDLARIDAGGGGRVWITGRLKTLIDVGAYKVNPLEVEAVLGRHPGVAECVVVPLAASETVQRLRAVVVACEPDRPPDAEELRRFLKERLSPIKVPRVVEVAASLPKSPTGKVLRDRV